MGHGLTEFDAFIGSILDKDNLKNGKSIYVNYRIKDRILVHNLSIKGYQNFRNINYQDCGLQYVLLHIIP